MNMFKASSAKTITEYIKNIPESRRSEFMFLHNYIKKTLPKLSPYFATNMIGYGKFPYLNYKKEKITWPIIALANQKQHLSIYVCSVVNGKYVAELHKSKLGKVTVGKSCIRIKNLPDLNLPELKKVLRLASKNPGLTK